jgi:phosphotransferase system HPr (HPr) family protein
MAHGMVSAGRWRQAERATARARRAEARERAVRAVEMDVRNPSGLHARPAALFVKTASSFVSTITVENLTREKPAVNAKSIIAILTAGVAHGHRIRILATGDDEEAAVATLGELVASGVGEPLAP